MDFQSNIELDRFISIVAKMFRKRQSSLCGTEGFHLFFVNYESLATPILYTFHGTYFIFFKSVDSDNKWKWSPDSVNFMDVSTTVVSGEINICDI